MTAHRSYGTTQDCEGCRYWSEMIARVTGGGPVEAICLSQQSPHKGQYVSGRHACDAWEIGDVGAIDSTGFDGSEYPQQQETAP